MDRISAFTDLTTPGGAFRYGTNVGGVAPTPVKAEWLNLVQEELCHFILAYLPALDAEDNTQVLKAIRAAVASYAVKATSLAGYGIIDAYTKNQTDFLLSGKANNAITLAGYGIGDAYTKTATDSLLNSLHQTIQAALDSLDSAKQNKNTALLNANGWKLDSATGLLEQWGQGSVGGDAVSAPIDFPTPFAEVYNCFGNKVTPNSTDGDANAAGAYAVSNTQYRLFNDTQNFGATIHWRAIGKAPGY
ncbi:phage tail protein [Pseudomonas sp. FP833]|uniref:gp53-like domain-containing protein n=1 Tax=Pseudomonas sp. FP833 TaxID=2954102 RepID=UPI0027343DAE|nr:phage tail protein [Pseudomonas sp. FP833]WLI50600.1 phage tail protein [Pseudomonas sp. FP833]